MLQSALRLLDIKLQAIEDNPSRNLHLKMCLIEQMSFIQCFSFQANHQEYFSSHGSWKMSSLTSCLVTTYWVTKKDFVDRILLIKKSIFCVGNASLQSGNQISIFSNFQK